MDKNRWGMLTWGGMERQYRRRKEKRKIILSMFEKDTEKFILINYITYVLIY